MLAGDHSQRKARRGVIIGELLLAVLLLAVAVSSLAALMYSVSRRTESRPESACAEKAGASASSCATHVTKGGGPKLLRSGCVTKDGNGVRGCNDSVVVVSDGSRETILKSRTDSVSLSLVAKKQKPSSPRPDRGFIR